MQQAVQKAPQYGELETRDIFHAAYLVTQGMRIKEIRPDTTGNRSKAIFVVGGEDIGRVEELYRSGLVMVNLFSLKEAVNRTKDIMYDYFRTRGIW